MAEKVHAAGLTLKAGCGIGYLLANTTSSPAALSQYGFSVAELDFDPDLHLIVDGEIVRPSSAAACLYRFEIPAGTGTAWLASRSAIPAQVEAGSRDRRRLGVPVARLALYGAALSIEMWHGHAALGEGFYHDERSHRWTDGLGRLPEILLRPFAEDCTLEVHLIPTKLRYHSPLLPQEAAAA